MTGRKLLVFYLIGTLVLLRCAGLHAHIHQHGDSHDAGTPEIIHLAKSGNHDGPHGQDLDIDLFNASMAKTQKLDPGALLLPVLLVLLLSVISGAARLARIPRAPTVRSSWFPFHPPSTAPPF